MCPVTVWCRLKTQKSGAGDSLAFNRCVCQLCALTAARMHDEPPRLPIPIARARTSSVVVVRRKLGRARAALTSELKFDLFSASRKNSGKWGASILRRQNITIRG